MPGKRNGPAGDRAAGGVLGDGSNITKIVDISQARPRIVVRRDIFGTRHCVEIYPRRVDRPTEFFRNAAAARQYAEELAKERGWLVDDKTGGGR